MSDKPLDDFQTAQVQLYVSGQNNIFNIEERGGGPEGIYYTHPLDDGEYLLRNALQLVQNLQIKYKKIFHL